MPQPLRRPRAPRARRAYAVLAFALLLTLLQPSHAAAVPGVPVPPDGLRLDDGRELALPGLVLDTAACPGPFEVALGKVHGRDRYGRLLADLRTTRGRDLVHRLVEAGCALVDPTVLPRRLAERLLFAERQAERRRRGLWRDPPVEEAARLHDASPRFALVAGRVRHVGRAGRYVYLDFGEDWRRDFSLRLSPAVQKELFADDAKPADLVGHRVRARGWILRQNGPMIHVTTVLQLEIAPP